MNLTRVKEKGLRRIWSGRLLVLASFIVGIALCPSYAMGGFVYPDVPHNSLDDPAVLWNWVASQLPAEGKGDVVVVNPESVFGPTNVNGVSGNGHLAAGFSREGELTVLRWPTPSHFDQVSYLTRDYYAARMGADPNDGSFAGIAWTSGEASGMSWFRDPEWLHFQSYWSDDTSILVTIMVNEQLGLTVVQTDFVRPYKDVLVRHYDITRDPASFVEEASLIYFENFNPCREKIPYIPVIDWVFDFLNDFAVVYSSRHDALIHFRPQAAISGRLEPFLRADQSVIDDVVSGLDDLFPSNPDDPYPPVYIAIGANFQSGSHQCGVEDQTGGQFVDAYWDSLDGKLVNNSLSLELTDGAMAYPLPPDLSSASLTVFIALAHSNDAALSLLEESRELGYEFIFEECREEWEEWVGQAFLPNTDNQKILATCKRSLQALRIGRDADSGCMVASLSTQPPYYVDWPRDGVFYNLALDLAGYHDIVTSHNLFYAKVQRPVTGSYEMNYYPDGMPGGPLVLEIDQDGMITWQMWDHAKYLEGEEREEYLKAVYPAIRRSADFMVLWRDPRNGLQLHSFEMDSALPIQGLAGAMGVYQGLMAAIQAGAEMGESQEVLDEWGYRAAELREAIVRKFWDEGKGTFNQGGFGAVYTLFPCPLFPSGDPRNESQAWALWNALEPHVNKTVEQGAYSWMNIIALAPLWRDDPTKRMLLEWAAEVLLTELPTPDTHHYGEGYILLDTDEGRVFENHVAMPHLGAHAQTFAGAMLLFGPKAQDADEDEGGVGEGGCGCRW